ncbi:beta-lactamase-like protein [Mycena polygramma]|nr:beta-lactamase-like protein [Mycena polygramma]
MSFNDLGIPTSEATVSLTAFDVVSSPGAVSVPAPAFFKPVLKGHTELHCPVFAFLIEHTKTGRRVLFDLGPRKDPENAVPSIAEAFRTGFMTMPVERDITEQLLDKGIALDTISAVIWSHSHVDHIGDMSKFPASIELVFGGAMATETYPSNQQSTLLDSDFAGRKLVPINFDESKLEIAGFGAHDFFGDGSLYVLDVPGHLSGHVAALARVTPTSFVYLGGDTCHHAGMFRPTAKLHSHFPCPGELLAATRRSVSATQFPPPDAAGQFDLAARTTPMLEFADAPYYEDPDVARISVAKMEDLDANKDVFVVLAHDESLIGVVGPFPASLRDVA